MAIDTMCSYVVDLRNDPSVRQSALMPFVVRKEKRKAKKQDSPKMERKVSFPDDSWVNDFIIITLTLATLGLK